jgi:hypothetical protein
VRGLEALCRHIASNRTAFERAYTKTRDGVATARLTDPWGTSIELREEGVRELSVSRLLVAPLTAASCARNHARQPERGQRQGRRFGNRADREGTAAKEDVICVALAWDLEGDPRKARRQQRKKVVIRREG